MNPRAVAARVVGRVRTTDAYANLVLPAELDRLHAPPRDAALATDLTYGTLRWLGTCDWLAGIVSKRPLDSLDPQVADALRLGAYQLRIAKLSPHAAVSETVAILRDKGARAYVNACLRKLSTLQLTWPRWARLAHPKWMLELFDSQFGAEAAEALCHANNETPRIGLRAVRARSEVAESLHDAGIDVRPGSLSSSAISAAPHGRVSSWPGFADGAFAVQDEASVLAAEAVPPGGTVVDLCAGPGGKTAQLAAGSRVIAVELHPQRARLIAQTAARLGVSPLVITADGRHAPVRAADSVLVDAPCTGLGVLRRRPEARWRVDPQDVNRAATVQEELLAAAWNILKPGGALVYAVCTLTTAETGGVAAAFAARHPGAKPVRVHPQIDRSGDALQLLPHVHGTDGMFICAWRKDPS